MDKITIQTNNTKYSIVLRGYSMHEVHSKTAKLKAIKDKNEVGFPVYVTRQSVMNPRTYDKSENWTEDIFEDQ